MDSKSCPDADANRSVPELTSKSELSVPDNVYVGAAVESASVTVRSTTSCTFSFTSIDESEVKTGAVSSTSVMVTVNVVAAVDPSALAASTVTVQLVVVSASSPELSATVTIPVVASTASRPVHDCSVTWYVTAFVVPSESEASTVMWADAPSAEFSGISLASPSESVGVETSASSSSVIDTENVVLAVDWSWLVASTVTVQVSAVS